MPANFRTKTRIPFEQIDKPVLVLNYTDETGTQKQKLFDASTLRYFDPSRRADRYAVYGPMASTYAANDIFVRNGFRKFRSAWPLVAVCALPIANVLDIVTAPFQIIAKVLHEVKRNDPDYAE